MSIRSIILALLLCFSTICTFAQEMLTPVASTWQCTMSHKSIDTIAVKLPFVDDFSNYEGQPDPSLWITRNAFVNKDYDPFPPTLGMVTLDAVDYLGNLHPNASMSVFSADTLASQLIRLDSLFVPNLQAISLSDSIRLSFYYLPGGGDGTLWQRIGDCPESQDSLLLEFFNANTERWDLVWGSAGISVDSLINQTGQRWQYVSIPIRSTDYLSSRFQFRFRNYCSLDDNPKVGMVSNCDQWNIDYVRLSASRSNDDQYVRDVAFVGKAPSLLNRYQAMPIRQFSDSDMVSSVPVTITNLYSQELETSYSFSVSTSDGYQIFYYDGGHENTPTYLPNSAYQTANAHANPSLSGFSFPDSDVPTTFNIVHVLKEGSSGDIRSSNDTMRYTQVLTNYYAYDDGIPENGYGITSTSSKIYLACRYDLRIPDTLTAICLYINKTYDDENEQLPFHICVWDASSGRPSQLIYRDTKKMFTRYDSLNHFVTYYLSDPIVIQGSVFVGIEQLTNAYINLGFDRTHDASQYIYYRTSSDWQQSILSGSLMLRPLFGYSATLATSSITPQTSFTVFPNPTSSVLHIESSNPSDILSMTLFDLKGNIIYQGNYVSLLDVSSLSQGIYLISFHTTSTPSLTVKKIVIAN